MLNFTVPNHFNHEREDVPIVKAARKRFSHRLFLSFRQWVISLPLQERLGLNLTGLFFQAETAWLPFFDS